MIATLTHHLGAVTTVDIEARTFTVVKHRGGIPVAEGERATFGLKEGLSSIRFIMNMVCAPVEANRWECTPDPWETWGDEIHQMRAEASRR